MTIGKIVGHFNWYFAVELPKSSFRSALVYNRGLVYNRIFQRVHKEFHREFICMVSVKVTCGHTMYGIHAAV